MANINADLNVNSFYDVARRDIASLIQGASVNAAVIYNNSDRPVTFEVYNYIDTANWIPAQKVFVAPGHYGTVAASGTQFKIHPDSVNEHEFLVQPGEGYVYEGPGKVKKA